MFTNYRYYTDNKSKVIAVSTYAGKDVRGIAICAPDDEFDLEKGKELAAARCNLKIANKRYAHAKNKYNHIYELKGVIDKEFDETCTFVCDAEDACTEAYIALKSLENSL